MIDELLRGETSMVGQGSDTTSWSECERKWDLNVSSHFFISALLFLM